MPHSFSGQDLACIRGERVVFTGVSFDVVAGGVLVLRGPNGSGKSSLLRLMAGLLRPAAGSLAWRDAAIDPAEHRARLHYVGHQNALKPVLTAAENLAFWAGLRGGGAAVAAALDAFDLARLAEIPARLLSAGEQRRLALARLAATAAPLWLLDEPLTGLDARAVEALRRLVTAHRTAGGMVVVSAHGPLDFGPAASLDLGDHARRRPARGAAALSQ